MNVSCYPLSFHTCLKFSTMGSQKHINPMTLRTQTNGYFSARLGSSRPCSPCPNVPARAQRQRVAPRFTATPEGVLPVVYGKSTILTPVTACPTELLHSAQCAGQATPPSPPPPPLRADPASPGGIRANGATASEEHHSLCDPCDPLGSGAGLGEAPSWPVTQAGPGMLLCPALHTHTAPCMALAPLPPAPLQWDRRQHPASQTRRWWGSPHLLYL